jgi:mevalonate kinase
MGLINDTMFYSKILLFGEYGIIEDSMGLSIPYNQFYGKLEFDKKEVDSNESLRKFAHYLKDLVLDTNFKGSLDINLLQRDIANGLCFKSSIPQGFGVGSSGALVASIYAQYSSDSKGKYELDPTQIPDLKNILGMMESYFHGKSSGLDPLICYLNLPVLIKSKEDVNLTAVPDLNGSKGAIFLINSGSPGNTSNMVSIFMDKCKEKGFRKMVKTTLKKYNDECINAFLNKDITPLFNSLKKLSALFLDKFSPMIPDNFETIWKKGLESNTYYLKLCGSGGGGYILGFTKDYDKTKQMLSEHKLDLVCNL